MPKKTPWLQFVILLPYRRRQRRLSGQVEELETNITDLLAAPLTDDDVDDFDLTTLRIEGEAELGAAIPSLSSYSLFNSAPYGNLGKKSYTLIMTACKNDQNLTTLQSQVRRNLLGIRSRSPSRR